MKTQSTRVSVFGAKGTRQARQTRQLIWYSVPEGAATTPSGIFNSIFALALWVRSLGLHAAFGMSTLMSTDSSHIGQVGPGAGDGGGLARE